MLILLRLSETQLELKFAHWLSIEYIEPSFDLPVRWGGKHLKNSS